MGFDPVILARAVPDLQGLAVDTLAGAAELRALQPGEVAFLSGEDPAALMQVADGGIDLFGQDGATVDTLRAGAVVAEAALTAAAPQPFGARACREGAVLLVLRRAAFEAWASANPDLMAVARAARRRREVVRSLSALSAFAELGTEAMEELADQVTDRDLAPGEMLIREGDASKDVYVVLEGSLRVTRAALAGEIARVGPGQIVGEMAALAGGRRSADVSSVAAARVRVIPAQAYCRLIASHRSVAAAFTALSQERGEANRKAAALSSAPLAAPLVVAEQPAMAAPAPLGPTRWDAARQRVVKGVHSVLEFLTLRPPPFAAVLQHSAMDCGAACLSTVCRHYGKRVDINRTRELARVGQAGAAMADLAKAFEALGFDVTPMLATMAEIEGATGPVVVNWKGYHWMVAYGVEDGAVVVADPAEGLRRIKREDFLADWSGYALVVKPNDGFQGIIESPPALRQFVPYMLPYRRLVAEVLMAAAAAQVLMLMLPLFARYVIDDVVMASNPRMMPAALVAISVSTVVAGILGWLRGRLLLTIGSRVNLDIVVDLYRHLLTLPMPFFEQRKVGDITTRFSEHEKVTEFFTRTGPQVVLDVLMVLASALLMLHFHVGLSMLSFLFLAANVLVVRKVAPVLRQAYREMFVKAAEQESLVIQSVSGAQVLKSLGCEHQARWRFEDTFAGFANVMFRVMRSAQIAHTATMGLAEAGYVAVLYLGALLIMGNTLSIGELMAFLALSAAIARPVGALVDAWDSLQEAINATERMNDVFEKASEHRDGTTELPPLGGNLRLEAVTFRYDSDSRNVLQRVDLAVAAGERVAFIGRSGCGKSTLIKLLYRFHLPTQGRILVDGFDISQAALPSLRRQISPCG
jgi:ATP-binding cassette subfamily B protein